MPRRVCAGAVYLNWGGIYDKLILCSEVGVVYDNEFWTILELNLGPCDYFDRASFTPDAPAGMVCADKALESC